MGVRRRMDSRRALAAARFYAINLALCPMTAVGYVLWVGALVLAQRDAGVSRTAQGPLTVRWTEHLLGTRRDVPAKRLMKALPGVPPGALALASGPLVLAHRLTGYVPAAFRYPFEGDVPPQYEASARVAFFDDAVERYLP